MAISNTQGVSANANNVAISAPTSGDYIIVFAFNDSSTTIPTLASGFTSITTKAGTLCAACVSYKKSVGTETSSGTWTNATNVVCLVYRGLVAAPIFSASGASSGTAITYPAGSATNQGYWYVGFAGAVSATAGMDGTTTAFTSNRTNQTTVNGLDTNGVVFTLTSQTLNVTGSGNWVAIDIALPAGVLNLNPGSYSTTGHSTTGLKTRLIGAGSGSYALTGDSANVLAARLLASGAGSYAITGDAATLLSSRLLELSQGTYAVTGDSAPLLAGRVLALGHGSYLISGDSMSFVVTIGTTFVSWIQDDVG